MTNGLPPSELQKDLIKEAHDAGLRYTSDDQPGITRSRHNHSFAYHQANGARVRDRDTLSRIKSLAIPPAWEKGVDFDLCEWARAGHGT